MGYDLHITRKADWSDEAGPEIGEDEWRRLIEEDPELSLDQESECWFDDKPVVYATWKGEPGVLGWFGGEISTKNPERQLILKMVQIAERLGATVQGDDGEEYPKAFTLDEVPRNAPWWRRLFHAYQGSLTFRG